MATREIVVLICDLCEQDRPDVETRRPFGGTIELEACERCWRKPAGVLEQVAAVGRKVRRKR